MRRDRGIFAAGFLLSVGVHAAVVGAFRSAPAVLGERPAPAHAAMLVAVPAPREAPQLALVRPEVTAAPAPLPKRQPEPAPALAALSPPLAAPLAAPTAVATSTHATTAVAPVEPPPVAATATSTAARRGAHSRYELAVAEWVERHRVYPLAARRRHWEGTAVVRLRLAADGSLLNAQLVRDTGFAVLDEAALGMVRRAAPFPRLPAEFADGQIEILVPIQFSLGS